MNTTYLRMCQTCTIICTIIILLLYHKQQFYANFSLLKAVHKEVHFRLLGHLIYRLTLILLEAAVVALAPELPAAFD